MHDKCNALVERTNFFGEHIVLPIVYGGSDANGIYIFADLRMYTIGRFSSYTLGGLVVPHTWSITNT